MLHFDTDWQTPDTVAERECIAKAFDQTLVQRRVCWFRSCWSMVDRGKLQAAGQLAPPSLAIHCGGRRSRTEAGCDCRLEVGYSRPEGYAFGIVLRRCRSTRPGETCPAQLVNL